MAEIELRNVSSDEGDHVEKPLETPKISLHHAARDNREDVVKTWIKLLTKSDVSKLNKKDNIGYAPIHYAAKFNRFDILVDLVEAGADPNIATREDRLTPLHFAARYIPRVVDKAVEQQESEASRRGTVVKVGKRSTSVRLIQYLVNLKTDRVKVNKKAVYGITPLHLACQRGNQGAVDILLRCNEIDVGVQDENKDTPLHEASLNGHLGVVKSILTRMKAEEADYAKVNPQNNENQTPLHLACREGYVEIVKHLLQHVGDFEERKVLTKTRDNENSTALHLACESGEDEIVRILVLNGAELSAVKLEGVNPMHIAARYGYIQVAETLVSSGKELVDEVEVYNQTPLHYAACHNQLKMIDFLIAKDADITANDTQSYTPLMIAAVEGHVDAFELLLVRGSPIDDVDENGRTVLHLAAQKNHVEVLQFALKNEEGLKLVNSTDSNYNTPLHLAALHGNIEAVNVIIESPSVKIDAKNELNKTPLHLAATKEHIPVIAALLKHQRDCILDEDEDGNTPLHLACIHGWKKSVKVLLDNGADFDARNASLYSPLDCAAFNGHVKVVKVLINAGAEVNPTDKQRTTPLHLASQRGHLNVVQLLLEEDAEVGRCDVNKQNSLDMAIHNGHEDIAMAIIESKQWASALRNTTLTRNGRSTTPLRKLIIKMPNVAEKVFNRCSRTNATMDGKIGPDSKKYRVTFDYEFLEDFRDEKGNICTRFFRNLFRRDDKDELVEDSPADEVGSFHEGSGGKGKGDVDILDEAQKPKKRGFTTFWGPIGFKKKLHPLSIMVRHNRTDLLKHPLVTSLLDLKWKGYGRAAYYSNLSLYILFVVFITTFALVSLNPQSSTCVAILDDKTFGNALTNNLNYNVSAGSCEEIQNGSNSSFSASRVCDDRALQMSCGLSQIRCGQCEGLSSDRRNFLFFSSAVVLILSALRLLFEAFQFINLRHRYIFDLVNWIEVILYTLSIIFVVVYSNHCLCPTKWQWQIGSIAVFLTWIHLTIFIRKLPLTGIYVLMFLNIFYTFIKVIILTMLLILAFALAFYMAFFDPAPPFRRSSFATPGRAIVKTMTMTTGEFEYDAIFRQFPGGAGQSDLDTNEIPFPGISFFLWIVFLALMPILLTNLLVGLAVDDIKGIQDAAVLKRLALKVDLVLNVEVLLPVRLRRWFIRGERTIKPNRRLNILEKITHYVSDADTERYDNSENITNALSPQPLPIMQLQSQTRDLIMDMKKMHDAITELTERNIVMEKLIQQMVKKEPGKSASPEKEESRSYI